MTATLAAPTPLAVPRHRPALPVRPERVFPPETLIGYWNHRCGHDGCPTWVPNHRTTCTAHGRNPS